MPTQLPPAHLTASSPPRGASSPVLHGEAANSLRETANSLVGGQRLTIATGRAITGTGTGSRWTVTFQ
jgi:hypothetical protein